MPPVQCQLTGLGSMPPRIARILSWMWVGGREGEERGRSVTSGCRRARLAWLVGEMWAGWVRLTECGMIKVRCPSRQQAARYIP